MVPLNSVSILNNFLYGLLIPQLVRIIPAYSMTRRVEIMHIQCAFVLKYSFWNIRAIIPFNKKIEKHIIAFDVSKLNFFIRAASTMYLVPATIFELPVYGNGTAGIGSFHGFRVDDWETWRALIA